MGCGGGAASGARARRRRAASPRAGLLTKSLRVRRGSKAMRAGNSECREHAVASSYYSCAQRSKDGRA